MVHYSIDLYKTTRCMHGGFRALESADEVLITHKSKAIVQYICEVLFIICCKVVLVAYESVDKILLHRTIPRMKGTEQYFSLVLFVMLNKMTLTFDSVNEIRKVLPSKRKLLSIFSRCCFLASHDALVLRAKRSVHESVHNRIDGR